MILKFILLWSVIDVVISKVSIDINIDHSRDVSISYSGEEKHLTTGYEEKLFNITDENLKKGVELEHGKAPDEVNIRSQTFKNETCNFEVFTPVSTIISIKSATIKNITKSDVVVASRDFENLSTVPTRMKGRLTHVVHNKLITNWSQVITNNSDSEVATGVDLNLHIAANLMENDDIFHTSSWGVSGEMTVKDKIGADSGFEMELLPGQAVTANMSVNQLHLEIEVAYTASLKGEMMMHYNVSYKNSTCWKYFDINEVLKSAILATQVSFTETLTYVLHTGMSLQMYDKTNGMQNVAPGGTDLLPDFN